MAFKLLIDSNSMLVNLTNIIFFMTVQTAFFYYIASNQLDSVIQQKSRLATTYLKKDTEMRSIVEAYRSSDEFKALKEKAEKEEIERKERNIKLIKSYVGPPMIAASLGLTYTLLRLKRKNGLRLMASEKLALLYVVGAYTTEAAFFFGIVRKFEFVGDNFLLSQMYERTFRKTQEKMRSNKPMSELCGTA